MDSENPNIKEKEKEINENSDWKKLFAQVIEEDEKYPPSLPAQYQKTVWNYFRNFDLIYSSIGFSVSNYLRFSGSNYWNASQVLDNLYLGDIWDAHNIQNLQSLGIKNIVCCIIGASSTFENSLNYQNLPIKDMPEFNIYPFFGIANRFINHAINNNEKVLVHCMRGQSRSASIILAYLMWSKKWKLEEATFYLQEKRNMIRPNRGFWEELKKYENELFVKEEKF